MEAALDALGIEEAAFEPLYSALREAFIEGGNVAAAHFTQALERHRGEI